MWIQILTAIGTGTFTSSILTKAFARNIDEVLEQGIKSLDDGSNVLDDLKKLGDDFPIPSVKDKEFNRWFDELIPEEFNEIWKNPKLRSQIEDRIRSPGGYHEWHLVSRTPKFKEWGVSMDDIKDMRSLIEDVEFMNPPGIHGGRGSTKAHNEIIKIIDSSKSYENFVQSLNEWASRRLKNGISDLPEGLRR